MSNDKDYSLLRPFDLEAAKAGELLCDKSGRIGWTYAAGPDNRGEISAIHSPSGNFIIPTASTEFRIAPLYWIEGRPVYKGDVLYGLWSTAPECGYTITHAENGLLCGRRSDGPPRLGTILTRDGDLSWTSPMVKREVKLLAHMDADQLFWLREGVQPKYPSVRVPSEDKTVEIEEPAK